LKQLPLVVTYDEHDVGLGIREFVRQRGDGLLTDAGLLAETVEREFTPDPGWCRGDAIGIVQLVVRDVALAVVSVQAADVG
jgi:hypothetical protein